MAEADNTYPGKVYLFVEKPDELLAAGYDQLRVYRRTKPTQEFKELTKEKTRITIKGSPSPVYNYFYLDETAERGFEYFVSMNASDDSQPQVDQGIVEAVDSSFEKVMTIQELTDLYLFGQEGVLTNDAGVPFPDSVYAHYIQAGIAKFEQKTDLRLCPTRFVETHDFFFEDWRTFESIFLDEYPVISIESLKLTLPGSDPYTLLFPEDWIKLERKFGQVHIVPSGQSPLLGLNGYWRTTMHSMKFLPQAYEITYFAGFENGKLPANLKDMVGKEASSGPLNLGGDLIGGAGIASKTISMDGLSTSINTTSSATNAGFGSRLIQYNKELKEAYPEVIRYYKGLRMVVA